MWRGKVTCAISQCAMSPCRWAEEVPLTRLYIHSPSTDQGPTQSHKKQESRIQNSELHCLGEQTIYWHGNYVFSPLYFIIKCQWLWKWEESWQVLLVPQHLTWNLPQNSLQTDPGGNIKWLRNEWRDEWWGKRGWGWWCVCSSPLPSTQSEKQML